MSEQQALGYARIWHRLMPGSLMGLAWSNSQCDDLSCTSEVIGGVLRRMVSFHPLEGCK